MTAAQKKLRKSLLGAIHTAPRYRHHYADDREAWEALLMEHYGVRSSAEMAIGDLIVLLEYLKMRREHLEVRIDRASEAQLYRLRQLWAGYARDTSDAALLTFVARYEGAIPLRLELLSARGAQKALIALRHTQQTPSHTKEEI